MTATNYTLADVSAGDRVTLEHNDGSKLVGFKVILIGSLPGIALPHDLHGKYLSGLTATGWRITAVVKPESGLPTEKGYYVGEGFEHTLWDLVGGKFYKAGRSEPFDPDIEADRKILAFVAPFTRLTPVPETAEKVLTGVVALMNDQKFSAEKAINRVAAEFGVPALTRQGDEK